MGKVTVKKETCKSCELCIAACPKGVLGLDRECVNAKGYAPATAVNEEACIACGICIVACPDVAIQVYKD
jgi:Predicted ATPase, RNase L inhibitor (RLI) homolog